MNKYKCTLHILIIVVEKIKIKGIITDVLNLFLF